MRVQILFLSIFSFFVSIRISINNCNKLEQFKKLCRCILSNTGKFSRVRIEAVSQHKFNAVGLINLKFCGSSLSVKMLLSQNLQRFRFEKQLMAHKIVKKFMHDLMNI